MTEFALHVFVISFFLILGSDWAPQISLRMWYGAVLLGGYFLLPRNRDNLTSLRSKTLVFFLCLLGFEIFRVLYGSSGLWLIGGRDHSSFPILNQYLTSPLRWSFYIGFFVLSLAVFRSKQRINRLLWALSWCSFFLAMNAIPALLVRGHMGYLAEDGQWGFFPPLFYSQDFVSKYLINRFAHINYSGDIIALGFFPSLGLFFYALHLWKERRSGRAAQTEPVSASSLALPGIFVATIALAVALILARGTITSFALAFFLYLLASLFKFPSRAQSIFTGTACLLVLGFLIWAGNPQMIFKEVETLKDETDTTKVTSASANREGARRALAIFRDHPIWGVGTNGYSIVSERYATPSKEPSGIVEFRAVSHYLQVLAEEGMGALFYFLFIAAYLVEVARGLLRTRSRFIFMACLGLSVSVLMILIHASFHYLMERFSISMLVYILMGASLAVLQPDFEHQ